ncbi:hypothetical protein [Algoriphagus alkaliphilus]|nr:hypothetical protein [Algoriphagus alkaliphilus]
MNSLPVFWLAKLTAMGYRRQVYPFRHLGGEGMSQKRLGHFL